MVQPISMSLSMLILKLVGGSGFVVKVRTNGSDSTYRQQLYKQTNIAVGLIF
jgi:hypothetical protein